MCKRYIDSIHISSYCIHNIHHTSLAHWSCSHTCQPGVSEWADGHWQLHTTVHSSHSAYAPHRIHMYMFVCVGGGGGGEKHNVCR